MITENNLKQILQTLNFKEEGQNIFAKYFSEIDSYLKVDFNKSQLIYPRDKGFKVNSEHTCNFSANENFVVFECVNRLFEKGYKPNHIELEPKWKVGHGASGGRADIQIKNNSGKSFLIIECKISGKEFNNEWSKTKHDGGQLFSYVQQAGSTEYICLYASNFTDNKISYQSNIIAVKDNEKLLEQLSDKKPLTFKEAKSLEASDIYKTWKETYKLDYNEKGIFEDGILPYNIGKDKYNLDDLNEIGSNDIQSKYHEFATIMRQYSVSGRENAFDKLVNLFLCKIVDEAKNPKDLKFNWRGIAFDSHFDLQDRLQSLYQKGMKEFLGEDVTYIKNEAIDDAFRYFKKDPDATKDTIKNYFHKLKFFTNNDFAFIDVHNEKLFYQNSEILLKIVQMLQNIRLKTETQNQFLGDMFEGFLDSGVKQSEGQFFTPMPIVKFILNSLPLEKIIAENELPPKVIDYSCVSGHFLNELALQIKPLVEKHKKTDIKEYYKEIVGVEKEYRLSKVAKVSAFMYGQDEINIIYGDALSKKSNLTNNQYEILVANPPYAVKGFLETLSEIERKSFELFNNIDDKSIITNNAIETFFIERTKQLLKPNAISAIILPSSILNKGNIYIKNREIILKYFHIIAIVECGSKTFGKTGTNTIILFLQKREENPKASDHFLNRVNSWFNGKNQSQPFADLHYIKKYCDHIDINIDDYQTLLKANPNDELLKNEIFLEYQKEFDKSPIAKNINKSKKPKQEKTLELQNKFTEFLQNIEKEKLYYFILAFENKSKILVIKSPSDIKEQKKFLGYEWSSAKGNEGIKYLGQENINADIKDEETKEFIQKTYGLQSINTPLYNPSNRGEKDKINYYIENNFLGQELEITEELKDFVSYHNLIDMLDFSRVGFDKQINLNPKKRIGIESKWDLVKIDDFVDLIHSGARPKGGVGNINSGAWSLGGEHIHPKNGRIDLSSPKYVSITFFNQATKGKLARNDILICKDGALTGKVAMLRDELKNQLSMVNEHLFIIRCKDLVKQNYIFNFLLSDVGQNALKLNITGAAQGGLNSTNLKNLKIPLPPIPIQQKIVDECQKIDEESEKAEKTIKESQDEIENLINKIISNNYEIVKISNIASINPSKSEIRNINDETIISFVEMASVSEKGFISNKVDRSLKDLRKGSYKYFRENDIIIAKITPCMENGKCAIANNLTNLIGMGSSEFHVIRVNEEVNNKYLFALLNREQVRKEAEKNMTGSS